MAVVVIVSKGGGWAHLGTPVPKKVSATVKVLGGCGTIVITCRFCGGED